MYHIPPRFPVVKDLLGFSVNRRKPDPAQRVPFPPWAKANIAFEPWLRLITPVRDGETSIYTKGKRQKKKGEWEKEDRRGSWVTWMDAWPERQRNLSNYSLPLLGLSRYPHHCSYKLTSSQRTSILQSSLSPTQLGFSLCKLSPTLSFTKAFISMDIYHNFPFLTIFQSFILSIHHGFCEARVINTRTIKNLPQT